MPVTPKDTAERYAEQCRAWDAERARLASRPWWRKAWDWQAELAARHGTALVLAAAAFAIAFVVACVVLFVGWLAS